MTKKPVDLSDDGELSQPVAYDEKPKRKRGESWWTRHLSMPFPVALIILVIVVIAIAVITTVGIIYVTAINPTPTDTSIFVDLSTQVAFSAPSPTPMGSCSAYPPEDGERIVYVNRADSMVYILNPATGNRCRLMRLLSDPALAFSPNGERIAFIAHGALEIIQVDSQSSAMMTVGYDANGLPPAWSPNGSQIAIVTLPDSYIHLVSANRPERIPNEQGTGSRGRFPAWSPDGTRIAYQNIDGYLYIMERDLSGRRVTNSDTRESFPSWSPDGTQILFARADENGNYSQIYTVNPDDPQQEHQLIAENIPDIRNVEWISVDRFAYQSSNQLHTRLFPPNEGSNEDTVILEGVSAFDWWTPPQ